jgi:hypothetical protein
MSYGRPMGATFVAIVWLMVAVGPGLATEPDCVTAEQAQGRLEVRVSIALAPEDAETVRTAVLDHLSAADVGLVFCRVPTVDVGEVVRAPRVPQADRVNVWVSRGGDRLRVLIAADSRDQIYIRQLPIDGPVGELVGEQLGIVVETNVGALARGETIGLDRADASAALGVEPEPPPASEPSDDVPVPPPKRRVPARLGLSAGYGVEMWSSSEAPRHGPHLHVELDVHPLPRFLVRTSLGALYHVPSTVSDEIVDIRLQTVGAESGVHVGWQLAKRLVLGGGALVGFEAVHRSGSARVEDAFTTPASWSVQARLGGLVELSVAPSSRVPLQIAFSAGVVADPVGVRYVADNAEDPIFEPWRARPSARLTLRTGFR